MFLFFFLKYSLFPPRPAPPSPYTPFFPYSLPILCEGIFASLQGGETASHGVLGAVLDAVGVVRGAVPGAVLDAALGAVQGAVQVAARKNRTEPTASPVVVVGSEMHRSNNNNTHTEQRRVESANASSYIGGCGQWQIFLFQKKDRRSSKIGNREKGV